VALTWLDVWKCRFSDLTGPAAMSVLEGKADFPIAGPDFSV
jgi:hypothetical protein